MKNSPLRIRPPEETRRRDTVAAKEDRRVLDILDLLAKCPECVGDTPSGAVFGCESCLRLLAVDVMES